MRSRTGTQAYGRHKATLAEMIARTAFHAYSYSYPHKTSYRPLERPVSLARLWSSERLDQLFLYVHLPFCEMRCGFCNLFTEAQPEAALPDRYLDTLDLQVQRTAAALAEAATIRGAEMPRFSRVSFGGGTPTFLSEDQLERLFKMLEVHFEFDFASTPTAIETSPQTATDERLRLASQRGIERVSIGVQSFSKRELGALGRPQSNTKVEQALDLIRAHGFPVLNIDLIYGMSGQTPQSFCESVRCALRWAPEEVYLYPLYVRPLTGLGRKDRVWDDQRLSCYRAGREVLLEAGYEQVSLRMFRASSKAQTEGRAAAPRPVYRCQEDGMVGLGCGARSYTRGLHYADEWAVGRPTVREIIGGWTTRDPALFDRAWHGYALDDGEQRRRYLIQSLLVAEGLSLASYETRFGSKAFDDFSELDELLTMDLAVHDADHLRLNARGLELSDTIGPWLYSDTVGRHSDGYDLR